MTNTLFNKDSIEFQYNAAYLGKCFVGKGMRRKLTKMCVPRWAGSVKLHG